MKFTGFKIGRFWAARAGNKIFLGDGKHALRYFDLKKRKIVVYKGVPSKQKEKQK
jgi:hypothetical protein